MNNKSFNILYVSHRYHTNQIPVMLGWNNIGVTPHFWAVYEGVGEVHDDVVFLKLPKSRISKCIEWFIDKFYTPTKAERLKYKYFTPKKSFVKKKIKETQPDIVILRGYYYYNSIIYRICKSYGINKVIMYDQIPLFDFQAKKHPFIDFIAKHLFPSVSFTPVLYKGNNRKKQNINQYWFSPKWFIPLIYDNKSEIRTHYCKEGLIRVLDIGKYRDYKNHFFLVDAISKLPNPEIFQVTIIGQLSNINERLYFKKLTNYVKEKKLDKIIKITKNVSYQEMDDLYSHHDILVLPSKNESAGMVILEALAHGLLVMGSINCGLTSYLDEYKCGFSFSTNSTDSLVKELIRVSNSPHIIEEYGIKGQQVVKDYFSFNSYINHLNKLTISEFNYKICH